MTTSPPEVPRQRLYQPNRRTHSALSKTRSVEEDMYVSPLCGPVTTRPRAPLLKGLSQDSAQTNREWNPRVIERTSDTCISRGSRDGGVSSRDNKSPRTPPQDLPRVTEVRDSGFSQGSRDSGVSQGSRDSGVSARDIEIPGSPPQDLSRDSGVSQGARDNIFLVSNKERSLKTENRMSYADKFLQQAPIPPPRRRKKKMVETTKL